MDARHIDFSALEEATSTTAWATAGGPEAGTAFGDPASAFGAGGGAVAAGRVRATITTTVHGCAGSHALHASGTQLCCTLAIYYVW